MPTPNDVCEKAWFRYCGDEAGFVQRAPAVFRETKRLFMKIVTAPFVKLVVRSRTELVPGTTHLKISVGRSKYIDNSPTFVVSLPGEAFQNNFYCNQIFISCKICKSIWIFGNANIYCIYYSWSFRSSSHVLQSTNVRQSVG